VAGWRLAADISDHPDLLAARSLGQIFVPASGGSVSSAAMAAPLEISAEGFLYLIDRALDGLAGIVTSLGDELANQAPDLKDTNTPYGIVNHCIGVSRWWAGHVVDGHQVDRDREHEWSATGPVAELVARVADARRALADAVAAGDGLGPPRGTVPADNQDTPIGATRGIALLHVYEELVQHLGQLELTRDILLARPA
jgi:hypothetical protein